MHNYTYTPVTVKAVCTLYHTLFARDFAAMGSYSFNPQSVNHGFPIIRLS